MCRYSEQYHKRDMNESPAHQTPEASTNNLYTKSLSSSYSDLINNGLSVMHPNIQSLRLDIIQTALQHYYVLIRSETWLSPDIYNDNFANVYPSHSVVTEYAGLACILQPSQVPVMLFSRKLNKPAHPQLHMNIATEHIESHKHLGITLSSDAKW